MFDATASYRHLRLRLFPQLISRMSKQKHLAGLQKVSIHQLHNWPPNQEGCWDPPKRRLSPRGRVLSGKRKDGELEGGTKRHKKEKQSLSSSMFPFLHALRVPNYSRLLLPATFSSAPIVLHHSQEQMLREIRSCVKNQALPKAAQAPH